MIYAVLLLVFALWLSFKQIKGQFQEKSDCIKWFSAIWVLSVGYSQAGAWIFTHVYAQSDLYGIYHDALILFKISYERPELLLELFHDHFEHLYSVGLYYAQSPRAVYAAALFSPFAGIFHSVEASFLAIACINVLVSVLFSKLIAKLFQINFKLLLFVFLILPSVAFWHSGLFKESLTFWLLAMWIMTGLLAFRSTGYRILIYLILWFVLGYLLYKLKYYVAFSGIILIALLLVGLHFNEIKWRLALLCMLAALAMYLSLQPFIHDNLKAENTLQMIRENHKVMLSRAAQGSSIQFTEIDGTLADFYIRNFPLAASQAWFGPLSTKTKSPFLIAAGIERLAFLLLTFYLFVLQLIGKISLQLRFFGFVFLSWALSLGLILGYATPNLGALFRYQSLYFPVFWLIILIPLARQGYFPPFKPSPKLSPVEKENIHQPPGV